ncbi:DUF7322 domain-containing protein [Natronolimnobius baerhuensis]|uniref:DUF7322 domain-containing protein n=1 Tax=Natronolimnobius baerhuensis TaxID=253108 RepID=A0A202ECU3_9EURY|nr:hypothetical protein [Natronolimnobius baerhuensis]OVE86049.1 hypothetical protein B2G88_04430 [Natronolimnobius baerhuensis]
MGTDRSDHDADESGPADGSDGERDGLSIPKVETEDAGSGFVSDLKSDTELEAASIPDITDPDSLEPESDVATEFEDVDFSEIPDDLLETFVALVLVINGAVLAVSLGALFLIFDGSTDRGIPLLVIGVVLFGFAFRRYRQYQRSREADDDETNEDTDEREDDTGDSGERPSSEVAEQRVPDDPDSS